MKKTAATFLLLALGLFLPASEAAAVIIIYNSDGSCKACIGSAAACKEACGKKSIAAGHNQMVSIAGNVMPIDVIEVSDVTPSGADLYSGRVTVTHNNQTIVDDFLSLDQVTVIDLDAQASNVVNDLIIATQCE